MRKRLHRVDLLLVVCCLIFAIPVPPAFALWAKSFTADETITGSIQFSNSGGYYLTGTVESETDHSIIAKIDLSGSVMWAKKLPRDADNFLVTSELSDGSFLVQGETNKGTGKGINALWAKFDSSFESIQGWQYAFGGDGDDYVTFAPTQEDSGFIGGGLSSSYGSGTDMLLIRLNRDGEIQWSKVLSIAEDDQDLSLCECKIGGGYAISTVLSTEAGGQNVVVIKLDSGGNIQWAKEYRAGYNSKNSAYIYETSDENFLLAGHTIPVLPKPTSASQKVRVSNAVPIPPPKGDMLLMKVDALNGEIIWGKKYGKNTDIENIEKWYFMKAMVWENTDPDHTLLFSGFKLNRASTDVDVRGNILVLHLDASGGIISGKMTSNDNIWGLLYKHTDANHLIWSSQVDIALSGDVTDINVLYGKLDSDLDPVWTKTFGGGDQDMGEIFYKSGEYFLSGTTLSFDSGKGAIFGTTLDLDGGYPDCPYVQDFSITWNNSPEIAQSELAWTAASITPEIEPTQGAETIFITVEPASLTGKEICSGGPESIIYVIKTECGEHEPCYSSITEGIASTVGDATIKIGEDTYDEEDVLMDGAKTLNLQGWDINFIQPSTPIIKGALRIRNGKIIIDTGGFIITP